MAIELSDGLFIAAPKPVDSRMVVATYTDLAFIAIKFIGLRTYVTDEDTDYRYKASGWESISAGVSAASVWGSITGSLADQDDLQLAFNAKFNVSGGTITGRTSVLEEVDAFNFILAGSAASAIGTPYVSSSVAGEPAGSSIIENAVFISLSDYNAAVSAGTLISTTQYVIT